MSGVLAHRPEVPHRAECAPARQAECAASVIGQARQARGGWAIPLGQARQARGGWAILLGQTRQARGGWAILLGQARQARGGWAIPLGQARRTGRAQALAQPANWRTR